MFRKIILAAAAALTLATAGYATMAFTVVMKSDPATVLALVASDRLPVLARGMAAWRVQSWDGCPTVNRGVNALGQTLRGYGLEGFDNDRVLETASQLLALGCDPDGRSPVGQTAMHEAILYNEPDVVRFLIVNGADPAVMIEVPSTTTATSLRHYAGMNAIDFAAELDAISGGVDGRDQIIAMLSYTRN